MFRKLGLEAKGLAAGCGLFSASLRNFVTNVSNKSSYTLYRMHYFTHIDFDFTNDKEAKEAVTLAADTINAQSYLKGDRDSLEVHKKIKEHYEHNAPNGVVSWTTKFEVALDRSHQKGVIVIANFPKENVMEVNKVMDSTFFDGDHQKAELEEAVTINFSKPASKIIHAFHASSAGRLKTEKGARCLITNEYMKMDENGNVAPAAPKASCSLNKGPGF